MTENREMNGKLDQVRSITLDRIERTERNFKAAFFFVALFEAVLLGLFLLVADFHDRTHILIVLATVGGYTIILLGMFALGAYVERGNARVLRSIELLQTEGKG